MHKVQSKKSQPPMSVLSTENWLTLGSIHIPACTAKTKVWSLPENHCKQEFTLRILFFSMHFTYHHTVCITCSLYNVHSILHGMLYIATPNLLHGMQYILTTQLCSLLQPLHNIPFLIPIITEHKCTKWHGCMLLYSKKITYQIMWPSLFSPLA